MKNVLIACEESQRTTIAFRKRGFNAFSCDIQESSGGHPEWHINSDVLPLLNGDCTFKTEDGKEHTVNGKWDLIIAHPPCTYLTVAGNRWFNVERYGIEAKIRWKKRFEAYDFFMKFINADCDHIAVENPVGYVSHHYRLADQIIHPYYFYDGNPENWVTKRTALWLKGLPKLKRTYTGPEYEFTEKWSNGKNKNWTEKHPDPKLRSKTFECVANAFAEQWGDYINEQDK